MFIFSKKKARMFLNDEIIELPLPLEFVNLDYDVFCGILKFKASIVILGSTYSLCFKPRMETDGVAKTFLPNHEKMGEVTLYSQCNHHQNISEFN
jgi:hypothetical protein